MADFFSSFPVFSCQKVIKRRRCKIGPVADAAFWTRDAGNDSFLGWAPIHSCFEMVPSSSPFDTRLKFGKASVWETGRIFFFCISYLREEWKSGEMGSGHSSFREGIIELQSHAHEGWQGQKNKCVRTGIQMVLRVSLDPGQ